MKAYEVTAFYVCQLSGHVLTELNHSLDNEPKSYLLPFSNVESATAYINREKRDWLLMCLEKFVLHKSKIIELSSSEEKKKELKVCQDALIEYEKRTTENVCKAFMKGIKYFEAILPFPNNPSYQSSCENLNELKKFCNNELKGKA